MKRRLAILSLIYIGGTLPLLAAPLQNYVTESGQTIQVLPQILVKYKPGREAAAKAGVLGSMNAVSRRRIPSIDVDVIPVPAGQTVQSFLKQLKSDPDFDQNFEYAEPNGIVKAIGFPPDPDDPDYAASQYSLKQAYTNVHDAWNITTGSPTIVVAVIDTGAKRTHTDLCVTTSGNDCTNGSFWINPLPIGNAGLNGTQVMIDWNGDGNGTDPANPSDPNDPNYVGPEQPDSPDPTDDNTIQTNEYHGTRVTGIISALTNNTKGIAGVAPGCKIMVVKVLNAAGIGSFETIATGITWAVDHGAKVINMSLGGPASSPNSAVITAVQYAYDHNVVVVAAAGNSGNNQPVNFPADISTVIAVGATDSSNVLAFFSCTGPALDLVAPGVGIISTTNSPVNGTDASGGNGTSFAAPIVSGVAALVLSLRPNATPTDVTHIIDFSATDLGNAGFDNAYGFGLLNAKAAVQAASTGVIPISTANQGETYPYPNPFHPAAGETATITLPTSLGTDGLEITIINIAGEHVRTLTGSQVWNGRNDDGHIVASGLYFYYAKTSKGNIKGKVSVIK